MSIVEIDTDAINNSLIPNASSVSSSLSSAGRSIYFPGSSYGWDSVRSSINSCHERLENYKSWISEISSEMARKMASNTENINSLSVNEVNKSKIVVNGK